jgi:two-component SAPR family response regulator
MDENTQASTPVSTEQPNVLIRTFGYFDVFVDGNPIAFRNKKSKELLALLVDRKGGYVTSEEAISFLWEDETVSTLTLSRYRKVALRLKSTLEEYGILDIIEAVDGKRRIVMDKVECDLYQYLSGKEEYAQLFKGSYLSNFSWGETTLGELLNEHMI